MDEAAKPKRRWLMSRRARRTLRRRAPLLVAAAAVIVVAIVAGLTLWAYRPSPGRDAGVPKTMTPAEIAGKYMSSVVRITTPSMPSEATGGMPGRIVGSGFMVSKDGVIVTSNAVVMGHGHSAPLTVTVEYALPDGRYGSTTGRVWRPNGTFGIALIVVDPEKVPLEPLPLGDSDSVKEGEKVVALGRQRSMSPQMATGTITRLYMWEDMYTGNDHILAFDDDITFPEGSSSRPLAGVGGPLFDTRGRVIGVVGARGAGGGDWGYSGDITKQAEAIWGVTTEMTYGGSLEKFRRRNVTLGIAAVWVSDSAARGLGIHRGGLVYGIDMGSGAEEADVRGLSLGTGPVYHNGDPYWLGGDVVVAIDGVELTSWGQVGRILARHKAGDSIPVRLWRDGQMLTLQLELTELPPV
jgi:S1-C subfamily serine protease